MVESFKRKPNADIYIGYSDTPLTRSLMKLFYRDGRQ